MKMPGMDGPDIQLVYPDVFKPKFLYVPGCGTPYISVFATCYATTSCALPADSNF